MLLLLGNAGALSADETFAAVGVFLAPLSRFALSLALAGATEMAGTAVLVLDAALRVGFPIVRNAASLGTHVALAAVPVDLALALGFRLSPSGASAVVTDQVAQTLPVVTTLLSDLPLGDACASNTKEVLATVGVAGAGVARLSRTLADAGSGDADALGRAVAIHAASLSDLDPIGAFPIPAELSSTALHGPDTAFANLLAVVLDANAIKAGRTFGATRFNAALFPLLPPGGTLPFEAEGPRLALSVKHAFFPNGLFPFFYAYVSEARMPLTALPVVFARFVESAPLYAGPFVAKGPLLALARQGARFTLFQ